MPKLPDFTALGERPTPSPSLGVTQYPNVGKAAQIMEEAGRKVEHAGNVIALANKRYDTISAEDAFNKLQEQRLNLEMDPNTGFRSVRGSNAIGKQFLDDYSSKLSLASKGIEDTLQNPQQKQLFRKRAEIAELQFKGALYQHQAQETDQYAKNVLNSTIDVETRNASANWNNPEFISGSLARVNAAINAESERAGWAPEVKKDMELKAMSQVHSSVIGQAVASGDYEFAKQYFDKNREYIDPNTAKAVERSVEDAKQKQLTNGYTAAFLDYRDDPKGLDSLEKRVTADTDLDEMRKNALIGRIQSRSEVLANRAERDRLHRDNSIQRAINQINQITLAGFEPTMEQMEPLINMTKGTEYEPEVKQMLATANATHQFRLSSPSQQETILNQLEANVRKDPSKFDINIVNRFRTIYDNQQKAVKEDPVSFAVRQGLIEDNSQAAKPFDLANPTPESLEARFDLALGMAQRYGAPVKVLTQEERDSLVSQLKNANPQQKRDYFAKWAQAAGNNSEAYKSVMGQIAPDDPVTAIAGVYAGRAAKISDVGVEGSPGQAHLVADLILQGQSILNPPKNQDGKPENSKLWPMPPMKDMEMVFQSAENDAFAGMPKARSDHFQAAQAIYAALSSQAGDASGQIDSTRMEEAIKLATGGIEKWNGKSIVMPWGYDRSLFKDGLYTRISSIAKSGKLDPSITPSKLQDMPLQSIGDGKYLFRAGDGILVDKYNKPVVVDFNRFPWMDQK